MKNRKLKHDLFQCKVCGSRAIHSNFGAISCDSCKKFFRRNAENKLRKFKCIFEENCEINVGNRHVCGFCRLKKCFQVGMSSSLFRDSYSRNKTLNNNQIIQLPTLNLLRSDQSRLSRDEWNLLSNLIHCYDERSTILVGERFVRDQNNLPIKFRFKIESISEMIFSLMIQTQTCLQYNSDFLSLSHHDQTVLINSTMKHVISISTTFALGHSQLLNEPAFIRPIEMIFSSNIFDITKRLINQLDRDDTFMKLIFSILVFSTTNYISEENLISINLLNLKEILTIQNIYIELAWKYLIYKYDYYQAIQCFSNIIRVIFISNQRIHQSQQIQLYTDTIHSLTKQTEQTFNIVN